MRIAMMSHYKSLDTAMRDFKAARDKALLALMRRVGAEDGGARRTQKARRPEGSDGSGRARETRGGKRG